jgi:hypothetical protein
MSKVSRPSPSIAAKSMGKSTSSGGAAKLAVTQLVSDLRKKEHTPELLQTVVRRVFGAGHSTNGKLEFHIPIQLIVDELGVKARSFGWTKFVHMMQLACSGTELCVAQDITDGGKSVIIKREDALNLLVLPDLAIRSTISSEYYRDVLAGCSPSIRVGDPYVLFRLSEVLVGAHETTIGGVLERIGEDDQISVEEARQVLGSFSSLGLRKRDVGVVQFVDQPALLVDLFTDADDLRLAYFTKCCESLRSEVGDVYEPAVADLVFGPDASAE